MEGFSYTTLIVDDPLADVPITQEAIEEMKRSFERWANHVFINGTLPPGRIEVKPGLTAREVQVTYTLSLLELEMMASHRQVVDQVIQAIIPGLAQKAVDALDPRIVEDLVQRELKDVVREEVKRAVAARVDEFIEEALGG